MNRITKEDFQNALAEVILPSDRIIVVYSGIWTFGHRFRVDRDNLPRLLLDVMLKFCGPKRTLALPTYTNYFARDRRYNPVNSKPETGILPETFLRQYQAARSLSAMNSFAAIGPKADKIAGMKGETLWGKGSVKEYLENVNARIVVIGLPWEIACGFFHRMEEVAKVPYRYFKTFHGIRVEDGQESFWSETMYVRPENCPTLFCWNRVSDQMRAKEQILSGTKGFVLESALAQDITNTGLEMLVDDPYVIVDNVEEVREWVQYGKQAELEELREKEPAALTYHDKFGE